MLRDWLQRCLISAAVCAPLGYGEQSKAGIVFDLATGVVRAVVVPDFDDELRAETFAGPGQGMKVVDRRLILRQDQSPDVFATQALLDKIR